VLRFCIISGMDRQHLATHPWRVITLAGAVLVLLGTVAFYIDVAARFRFDFIEHHYDEFGMSILIGVVCCFAGCIGWARLCNRQHRAMMAAAVFVAPIVGLLLGSPIGGMNIHGPSAITTMLTLPATVLAVILLIMAAFGSHEAK
jgi:multisubunit Na+/H+ antiporter MnhG subunit